MKRKINFIHSVMEHPWDQGGFRIRDPDNHIIEFSGTMENVVKRLHKQGLSLEEINKKTTITLDFIENTLNK